MQNDSIGFFQGRNVINRKIKSKEAAKTWVQTLYQRIYGSKAGAVSKRSTFEGVKRIAEDLGDLFRKSEDIQNLLNNNLEIESLYMSENIKEITSSLHRKSKSKVQLPPLRLQETLITNVTAPIKEAPQQEESLEKDNNEGSYNIELEDFNEINDDNILDAITLESRIHHNQTTPTKQPVNMTPGLQPATQTEPHENPITARLHAINNKVTKYIARAGLVKKPTALEKYSKWVKKINADIHHRHGETPGSRSPNNNQRTFIMSNNISNILHTPHPHEHHTFFNHTSIEGLEKTRDASNGKNHRKPLDEPVY